MSYRGMGNDGNDFRQQAAEALPRQPSIYSLTFDEFQSTMGGIGKDFGSMNMDEFLKNIWTSEESLAVAAALGAPDGGASDLQRQGSLALPRTLSQKTVDEVWRGLTRDEAGGSDVQQQQQQPTLGEMTLEEFLVRAGVVREEINPPISRPVINSSSVAGNRENNSSSIFYGDLSASSNGNLGFSFGFPQVDRSNVGVMPSSLPANSGANLAMSAAGTRPYAPQLPLDGNVDIGSQQGMRGGGLIGGVHPEISNAAISNGLMPGMVGLGAAGVTIATVREHVQSIRNLGMGSPGNQIPSDVLVKGNGELSSLSPVPYMFGAGLRRRKCNGAVEKVVERRQRRMIKNRESAARSRARKQAYTMELEAEVANLKEQNQGLQKKQAEVFQMQKNQVLELLNQQHGPKKLCLRRTHTGPW